MTKTLSGLQIISGGQRRADRAALDAALQQGIPCERRRPKGRKTEDGRIPHRCPLQETLSSKYPVRTRLNVRDADRTLILTARIPSGGTALTTRIASEMGRVHFVVDLARNHSPKTVRRRITENRISNLDVAWPRESSNPVIYSAAMKFPGLLSSGHRDQEIPHLPVG